MMKNFLRSIVAKENLSYLVGAVASGVVALEFRPHIQYDDIAISFRYAHRFVQGSGLTYNDHERVLGFSNPLYTLLLSSLHFFGADLESATYWFDVVLLVGSVLIAIHITMRLSHWVGGLFVGLLLAGNFMLYYQGLHGMESILSIFLGMMFIAFLFHGRDGLAGVVLGLCVWNKLDSAILALAFLAAWVIAYRTIPFKVILISILVVLPWAVFAATYYGSPIPHSLETKYMIHGARLTFDHFWVLKSLTSFIQNYLLSFFSLFLIFFYRQMSQKERLGLLILLLWFIGHALAFSLLNLGDYFPWYLAVLSPLLVVLGTVSIARIIHRWIPHPFLRGAIEVAIMITIVWFSVPYWNHVRANPITSGEAFDSDRRLAGIFVSRYGDSTEVLRSSFGWPAYEASNPFNDNAGLNSIQDLDGEKYVVTHGKAPINQGFSIPIMERKGFVPLANFTLASDLFPGHTWFTVFGSSDSKIARSGNRYLPLRLFELQQPDSASVTNKRVDGIDLIAIPPGRADFTVANDSQLVRVVFIPSVTPQNLSQNAGTVEFRLCEDDSLLFSRSVSQTERQLKPVILTIPRSITMKSLRLSFRTSAVKDSLSGQYDVRWKNVKVIIGDAIIDANRIPDKALRESWLLYNPAD
jgi:hypothetical protein